MASYYYVVFETRALQLPEMGNATALLLDRMNKFTTPHQRQLATTRRKRDQHTQLIQSPLNMRDICQDRVPVFCVANIIQI